MPGSKTEMSAFESEVKDHSRVSLDFNIPEVLVYLQDKKFFEVLYNRLLYYHFYSMCLKTVRSGSLIIVNYSNFDKASFKRTSVFEVEGDENRTPVINPILWRQTSVERKGVVALN